MPLINPNEKWELNSYDHNSQLMKHTDLIDYKFNFFLPDKYFLDVKCCHLKQENSAQRLYFCTYSYDATTNEQLMKVNHVVIMEICHFCIFLWQITRRGAVIITRINEGQYSGLKRQGGLMIFFSSFQAPMILGDHQFTKRISSQ